MMSWNKSLDGKLIGLFKDARGDVVACTIDEDGNLCLDTGADYIPLTREMADGLIALLTYFRDNGALTGATP